ncbi:homoserine/homoserine lactone efflux protein [Photobacterium sagamiensis]|uniref:homoserine/homoserine lactone efflux protein n=1 Tax=Photobacterium sagamiensis TaxID=2910241 RepID=UPI003D0C74E4
MEIKLWLAFLVASLLISISPGAGAVNTMSNGLQNGVKRTLPSIFGLQLGYGIQIILVGVGLGKLLASSSLAFEVVKWLGVTYLVWLGYKKWTQTPLGMEASASNKESKKRQFWVAAFVNLTNPKATIFLLALFPQFIDIHADTHVTQYVVMGTTLILTDIAVMIGYASLAAQLSRWMNSKRHQVVQNRIFGGMFIVAATVMAGYRSS